MHNNYMCNVHCKCSSDDCTSSLQSTSSSGVNNSMQYSRRDGRRRRVRNKRRKNRKGGDRLGMTLLSDINNRPIQTRVFRYFGSLNSRVTFTSQDLSSIMGAVTSGATTFYPLIDGFQISRVGITLLPNNTTSAGTVSFSWSGLNAPDNRHTMLVANSIPYHQSFIPVEGTSAWFWWDNTSSTTNLFQVASTLSSDVLIYIDFDIKYVLNTGATTSVALTANATFTGIGYRQLPIGNLEFSPADLDTVH
jgi:hypothetical protein